MAKPALFIVAPDADFLKIVARHLNSEFGDRFSINTSNSGASTLSALNQLKQSHEPVALFLVEQQMPEMTGIDFFEQAIALFPEAKRILLTDVETDAEIRKIKTVNIDCYLLKLSDPPENRLYPTVQDLRLCCKNFSAQKIFLQHNQESGEDRAQVFAHHYRSPPYVA